MTWYSRSGLADGLLTRSLATRCANVRTETAQFLADLAEFDARQLFRPAAYPSMHAYCTGVLGMTDDVAGKHIQAARAARLYPALFDAVREGRLRLSGVCLLAPKLAPENAAELIALAERQSFATIRQRLAERAAAAAPVPACAGEAVALELAEASPGAAPSGCPGDVCDSGLQHAAQHVRVTTPGQVTPTSPTPVSEPAVPPTFELRVRLDAAAQADLRHAQDLLAHVVRHGDVSQVIGRALKALVRELEKRRCGATDRPRQAGARRKAKAARDPRHVPAHVRGAVWQRDGGRCTFTSEAGRRCEATALLELDHVTPVAKGGGSTVANLRLRCRAHNQYAAEQAYGAGFMQRRREAAKARAEAKRAATAQARGARATTQRQAAETRAQEKRAREAECREASEARAQAREAARAAAEARTRDEAALRAAAEEVIPWLREMGCRPPQARSLAADAAAALPDAPLDARVKHALQRLGPPSARTIPPPGCSPA